MKIESERGVIWNQASSQLISGEILWFQKSRASNIFIISPHFQISLHSSWGSSEGTRGSKDPLGWLNFFHRDSKLLFRQRRDLRRDGRRHRARFCCGQKPRIMETTCHSASLNSPRFMNFHEEAPAGSVVSSRIVTVQFDGKITARRPQASFSPVTTIWFVLDIGLCWVLLPVSNWNSPNYLGQNSRVGLGISGKTLG